MSHDIAISVEAVSKAYRIWNDPSARLKAPLLDWAALVFPRQSGPRKKLHARACACYHDFHALRSVSFQVRRSECVGILGYNGSGKSTLLQIIAGTLQPTEGSVAVNGRVAAMLELGSGFNPEFTGRENALLYGSIMGISRAEMLQKLPAIEDFAEIGEFIEEPVRSYSSGMVVRLAFAVLTQLDPEILIIDEALAVGDAYFQHKSMQRTRSLRDAGKCVLLVTHDTGTIKSMCDRAIILERGLLIREGPAEAVADYYTAMVAKKTKDAEIRQFAAESGRVVTRSGNRQAVITRCDLFNEAGASARAFTTGEAAQVACAVQFNKPIDSPTVGFLVRDRLGNSIFGTNTFHLRLPARTFQPGEEPEFVFQFPMTLGPGSYSLTVAVHADDNHLVENFDWFDNVIVFEVLPGSGPLSAGCAYLPVVGTVSDQPSLTRRNYTWSTLLECGADGVGSRHLVSGWSAPERQFTWSEGDASTVAFEVLGEPVNRTLRAALHAYVGVGRTAQRVLISLNGKELGEWNVAEPGEYRLPIPAGSQPTGNKWVFTWRFPDSARPSDTGESADHRKLGIALKKLGID